MKLEPATMYSVVAAFLVTLATAGNMGGHVALTKRAARIQRRMRGAEGKALAAPDVGFESPFNINPKRCTTGFWRVGCVHNVQILQQRDYKEVVPKEDRVEMTIDVCWNFCKSVSGAQFFALERGGECHCMPFFENDNNLADKSCDQPCDGDASQMCGGDGVQDIFEMHDCNNMPAVPCKRSPAPVPNAKTFKSRYYRKGEVPCKNGIKGPLTTVDFLCQIECEIGYYVAQNDLKCMEKGNRLTYSWAQMTGSAYCAPINCGAPKKILNAKFAEADVYYGNHVTYACDLGSTLDGTAQGRTQQDVACLASGKMYEVQTCKPVGCGECPSNSDKYPNGVFRERGMRTFKDVCSFDCKEGYSLDQLMDGIKEFKITCLLTGEFEEPPKCKPIKCGTVPKISRANIKAESKLADGKEVVFPQVLKYECQNGYTLDGFPKGNKVFELSCKAAGLFSDAPVCSPVSNGNPPKVIHSDYTDRQYVYGESVTYNCHVGYTMTGMAFDRTTAALLAGADGSWQGDVPRCLPVVCGPLPQVVHATLIGSAPAVVTFATPPIPHVCAAGFSTVANDDIWKPASNGFLVSCQASGQFVLPACVNIDDCLMRNCGAHGSCKDLPVPVGTPLDDYTCECDSGYEITLHESELKPGQQRKLCTNIYDCPSPVEEACGGHNAKNKRRGLCQDGVNKYTCDCAPGYEVVGDGNQTCTPVHCGTVAGLDHATSTPDMVGKAADYDAASWRFTCKSGYTLNGQKGGSTSFSMSCMSEKSLSPAQTCKPVSCGAPKFVGNADMAPETAELFYEQHVLYTCDEGYALKGDPKGLRSFQVDCLETGDLSSPDGSPGGELNIPVVVPEPGGQPPKGTVTTTTTPLSCLPVICGVLRKQQDATWNETRVYVFLEAAKVACQEGFSIDRTAGKDKDEYDVWCQSDGSFKSVMSCLRIQCEDPKDVIHTERDPSAGPFYYGDKVKYTVEAGFQVDTPEGRINTTFDCHCTADARWNGTCATDIRAAPIDCGTAPTVEHATVTGDTHYGGMLKAKANTGFTLDGTAKGQDSFTFLCQADGRFSPRQKFEPVACGLCSEIPNVQDVALEKAVYNAGSALALISDSGLKVQQNKVRKGAKKLYDTFYKDLVEYTCAEGYHAVSSAGALAYPTATVSPDEPKAFVMKCQKTGDFKVVELPPTTRCLPVTCDVAAAGADAIQVPVFYEAGVARLTYQQKQNFACSAGYSLDGTPDGVLIFAEACTAAGTLSANHLCRDIDWCLKSQCGPKGKCNDDLLTYRCQCDPGYQATLVDGWETCTQILECQTQGGEAACSNGGGKCIDETLRYICECATGYEVKPTAAGLESCSAKLCSPAPTIQFASSEHQGQKLSYRDTSFYTCFSGYSTNGKVDGPASFKINCDSDAQLQGSQACSPVQCPPATPVERADINGTADVKFGEHVAYKCQEGHTITGFAGTAANFVVQCLASGQLAPAQACRPVVCGHPPALTRADVSVGGEAETTFGQKLNYVCAHGYSLNGQSDGEKAFDISCQANGQFDKLPSCKAISCGEFPGTAKAQYPIRNFSYPASVSVVCDTGYTVNGAPRGQSTFVSRCGADGTYKNVSGCKPVTCGVPKPTNSTTTVNEAVLFGQVAVWTCKEGFSTDRTVGGPRTLSRTCEASGSFGRSDPNDCLDINFCTDAPCTANGVCTDLGAGVPFPGYSCMCYAGFEVRRNADGSEKCSADDCAGSPCGEGGTCSDLSKSGGPQDAYTCECSAGFELVEAEKGPTCQRTVCGILPEVHHQVMRVMGHRYDVRTWKGGPVQVDGVQDQPILRSFDVATYFCKEGFSTDGRVSPESKSFSVSCLAQGILARPVQVAKECQFVQCDNAFFPVIQFAIARKVVPSEPSLELLQRAVDKFFFQDVAEFECGQGYTLTGAVGGKRKFTVQCEANGEFTKSNTSCKPISCVVPNLPRTSRSKTALLFGESVSYACDVGYGLNGLIGADAASVVSTCTGDGSLRFAKVFNGCEPVRCGAVPSQPDASPATNASHPAVPVFGDVMRFVCNSGSTLGGVIGGAVDYEVSCGPGGALSGVLPRSEGLPLAGGPPATGGICEPARLRVSGVITDAQDGNLKIQGASVSLVTGDGNITATMTTNAVGVYSAKVPIGNFTIKVTHPGFIAEQKGPFFFGSDVRPGQSADVAMSKPLPPDGWRVVLSWNQMKDLDAHAYFGCEKSQNVYFKNRFGTSERGGGLTVNLDVDAANGYGPETMTIRNSGNCREAGCCLITFKVNRFSSDMNLKDSAAVVKLYKGTERVGRYTVPLCLADAATWWTVFTIDATTGQNVVHEGDMKPAPYVKTSAMGVSDWSLSFDSAQLSTVQTVATGVPGFMSGFQMMDRTKLNRWEQSKFYDVIGQRVACTDVAWTGLFSKGEWALCPAGWFLHGLTRTGNKMDKVEGVEQLVGARCCSVVEDVPPAWGTCSEQATAVAQGSGWSECQQLGTGQPTIMVGLRATVEAGTAPPSPAYVGPLAKHGATGSGIFIGGDFIELGFRTNSDVGKMGADGSPPPGFVPRANGLSGIGMTADGLGFADDPSKTLVVDYFLPGSPEESFWAGYKQGGTQQMCRNCGSKVENTSPGGPVASTRTTAVLNGNLQVIQEVTLGVKDRFFKNTITLKNIGPSALTNVRFMRSVDPDNTVDQNGNYVTNQKLEATVARDGFAAVSATSLPYDQYFTKSGGKSATLVYYSDDPRAKASFGEDGLAPGGIYDPRIYDGTPSVGSTISTDAYISMAFDVGTLPSGQATTMTYYTMLDSRPVSELIAEVKKAATPVLVLTQMKCCSLPLRGPLPGPPTCFSD